MSTPALQLPLQQTYGPGFRVGLSMAEYLALPFVSASGLEKLRRSPLQYRHAQANPPEPTPAMDRGEALHMALLEPDRFAAHYLVAGPCGQALASGERKGDACGKTGSFLHRELGWLCGQHVKRFWDGVRQDVVALPADDFEAVVGMRACVMAHPRASTLFRGQGGVEVTGIFKDPATGLLVKFRPDRLVKRAGLLVDLKMTRDAAPWAFGRDAESRGYWRKMALYRRGARELGWPYQGSVLVAAESDRPHDVAPYLLDEAGLDAADVEVSRLLRVLKTCQETGRWPGYTDEFLTLARPAWAGRESED